MKSKILLLGVLSLLSGCMASDLSLPLGKLPEGEKQITSGMFSHKISLNIPKFSDETTSIYFQNGKQLASPDDINLNLTSCMIRISDVQTKLAGISVITLPANKSARVTLTRTKSEYQLEVGFKIPTKIGALAAVRMNAQLYCLNGLGASTDYVQVNEMLAALGFTPLEMIGFYRY